jgi:cobalamin biosynthesis protein CobD/CbiB
VPDETLDYAKPNVRTGKFRYRSLSIRIGVGCWCLYIAVIGLCILLFVFNLMGDWTGGVLIAVYLLIAFLSLRGLLEGATDLYHDGTKSGALVGILLNLGALVAGPVAFAFLFVGSGF